MERVGVSYSLCFDHDIVEETPEFLQRATAQVAAFPEVEQLGISYLGIIAYSARQDFEQLFRVHVRDTPYGLETATAPTIPDALATLIEYVELTNR